MTNIIQTNFVKYNVFYFVCIYNDLINEEKSDEIYNTVFNVDLFRNGLFCYGFHNGKTF